MTSTLVAASKFTRTNVAFKRLSSSSLFSEKLVHQPGYRGFRNLHSSPRQANQSSTCPDINSRLPIWSCVAVCASIGLTGVMMSSPGLSLQESQSKTLSEYLVNSDDPLEALSPEILAARTSHLVNRPTAELLRSYITFLLCEIPALVSYGPAFLESYKSACESIPVIGPLGWMIAESIMRQTFFAHYTGGETPEDCLPVLQALHQQGVGTLLNYSVEGPKTASGSVVTCAVSQQHIDATVAAVSTAARFGMSLTEDRSPDGSASVRPTTLALKLSGMMTDPYVFERASTWLSTQKISPFQPKGELFPPPTSGDDATSFSETDRAAMNRLMTELRRVCRLAKDSNVLIMIDAEYSWFQPALDRFATFLAAEFNRPDPQAKTQVTWPTVYNTFQALLRSTPTRIDESISAADSAGYSTGIKLVRGAYLVAESEHWPAAERPVWPSKDKTDECFDSIASRLTSRLASDSRNSSPSAPRLGVMIAGHNVDSTIKVVRQLRDREGLAQDLVLEDGRKQIALADSLRGRIMFAQLYGMTDQLTSTLSDLLTSPTASKNTESALAPFVHKYLPFGSVSEVMPYLARRAEENQSILQNSDGRPGGATVERRVVGKELRRRMWSISS